MGLGKIYPARYESSKLMKGNQYDDPRNKQDAT